MSGRWWHGGPHVVGDRLEPGARTGTSRAGDPDDWVYVTPRRHLALTYAATLDPPGWVYEVAPDTSPVSDPDSLLPDGASARTTGATILRRERPSRAEVAQARAAVARAERLLAERAHFMEVTDE